MDPEAVPSSLSIRVGRVAQALTVAAAAAACAPQKPVEPDGLALTFEDLARDSRLAPRFAPSAAVVPLEAVKGGPVAGPGTLEAFLPLGPALETGVPGFPLLLRRSGAGDWDLLVVDADGDGSMETVRARPEGAYGMQDGEAAAPGASGALEGSEPDPRAARFQEGRISGQHLFVIELQLDHIEGARGIREPYTVGIVVEAAASDPPAGGPRAAPEAGGSRVTPKALRVTGFAFRRSEVTMGDAVLTVLLADADSDGIFGAGDLWTVTQDADLLAGPFTRETAREVGDFAWASGRAWILTLDGTAGRRGRLVPHDPGITRDEDGRRRGTYAADRALPRAARPLRCRNGALAPGPARSAEGSGSTGDEPGGSREPGAMGRSGVGRPSRLLLYFTASGCGPCEDMEQIVLSSQAVAEAAGGIECRRVDVGADPSMLARHALAGIPALLVLDGEGIEEGRHEGYAGVATTASLLRRVFHP